MDISLFFDALSEKLVDHLSVNSLGMALHIHAVNKPSLNDCNIALFSVGGKRDDFNEVREELYSLKQSSLSYAVADLGHLRAESKEQTIDRLKEVSTYLIELGIIPVILGTDHDLDLGQYAAFEHSESSINYTVVDHSFDLGDEQHDGHLFKNLTNPEVLLDQYTHLGHQSYFVDNEASKIFEKLNFEGFRLGYLKSELKEVEPCIRKSHALSFDLSSIKYSESKAVSQKNPFGLLAEEACQIAWYSGLSDYMKSFGLYDYQPVDDYENQSAKIIATMLWFFIDGVYHRKDSKNFEENDYLKYIIFLDRTGEELVFYKNVRTEKWWLKVHDEVIPCSYNDYELAASGEIPDRWLNEIVRRS